MNGDRLTSEQMDALLMHPEMRDAEMRERSAHQRECDDCSMELESLEASLNVLRGAVIAAAELHRRSAVMPAARRRMPSVLWSLAAAAVVLCIAIPMMSHRRPARIAAAVAAPAAGPQARGAVSTASTVSTVSTVPTISTVSTISTISTISDNQLMSDIQQDLETSVPRAMLPLTAREASTNASGLSMNSKENE